MTWPANTHHLALVLNHTFPLGGCTAPRHYRRTDAGLTQGTRRKIASTVSIQSAWRAHTVRLARDVTGRTIRRRAVVCIQRAWRSRLFLAHLRSLEAAQLLMHSMSAVTVVPNLCLTLLSARMLGLCLQRRSHCLPLHRLKWGYLQTTGGVSASHTLPS